MEEEDGEGKKMGEEERKERAGRRGAGGGGVGVGLSAEHPRGGREAVCKWIIRKAPTQGQFLFYQCGKITLLLTHAIILPTLKTET